ncbi:hypothetical protein [Streptomyces sp. LMG1-1-1.1]|uniref:hypothetical protein n=1 Tax=Streptomyces sp. LMG1-1-1.1 TaxID=3135245 RepID=UPI0034668574
MDPDRALALEPDYVWALVRRSRLWSALTDADYGDGGGGGGVADLDRALGMDPEYAWARARRAEIVAATAGGGAAQL